MKTAPKSQGLHQLKTHNRWKWMAGATAVSAAAATNAQAGSMVTINLSNNFISYDQGNHLSANIFGDGNIFSFFKANTDNRPFGSTGGPNGRASLSIRTYKTRTGGGNAYAGFDGRFASVTIHPVVGASTRKFSSGITTAGIPYPGYAQVKGAITIWFMDPNANGGALTEGFLKVTSTAMGVVGPDNLGSGIARIDITSFMYMQNMPTSAPEGGSTLALLAMGAGGVIAFRRRRV